MDLLQHYEAIYDAINAATSVTVVPVTSYEEQTGTDSIALPYITYRQEVERAPYGTPGSGSAKVLRSNWLISSYATGLDDAISNANDALGGLVDNEDNITTDDGYVTTFIQLVGFMPLFERTGPNYVVHARIMWERSI